MNGYANFHWRTWRRIDGYAHLVFAMRGTPVVGQARIMREYADRDDRTVAFRIAEPLKTSPFYGITQAGYRKSTLTRGRKATIETIQSTKNW